MLKKQTVWLLTMLSLMIVLSIYYMTSPDNEDLAYIDTGKESSKETTAEEPAKNDTDAEVDNVANVGEDELFTTLRMELEDERSATTERLNEIVASSSASLEEKNKARDDINVLEQVSTKESILEESILAAAEYQDVLVRSDGEKVHVHVKVDELSKEEAVNIMQMVRDEFGEVTVDVNFQPTSS